jgi:septal ring factor EnvC (AmiA/AmiB activator)
MNRAYIIKEINEGSKASQSPLSTSATSSFTQYYHCDQHNHEEMKLFCVLCNQFACTSCIDDHHTAHSVITALKYVVMVKEKWRKNVEEVITDHSVSSFIKSIPINENSLKTQIEEVDNEINKLNDQIKLLNIKKEKFIDQLNDLSQSKVQSDLTSRYLSSFIQSLPPLPLSSFHSPSSHLLSTTNNDINNNIDQNNNINNNNYNNQ